MVTKKKAVIKKRAKVSLKKDIFVCVACHSPDTSLMVFNGKNFHLCGRCGHKSLDRVKKSHADVKKLIKQRTSHAIIGHRLREDTRHKDFSFFVKNFHLRMWFKIVSTFLIGFAVVLLPTKDFDIGLLFLVVGSVGFYFGVKEL